MITQRPLKSFKDQKLDDGLWEKGYVVVPFFDPDTIKEVLDFCSNYTSKESNLAVDEKDKMYASTHSPDIDYKDEMNERIKDFYRPFVEQYFENPEVMGGSFILKPVGKGISQPHLDWNLVEEGPYRSCNFWVPLVDLHKDNGVIEVLPGSHKLYPTYRGPNVPELTRDLQEFYWDTMIQLHMKAGEALIYDHRLIHGSRDNMSNEVRPATACAVTNKSAELRLYYLDKQENKVEAFSGDNASHLLTNDRFEKPKTMKSLGFIEGYTLNQITESDYDFLNLNYTKPTPTPSPTPVPNNSLWNRIKSMFTS
ncbi:MAG: hypothetical protein ACI94Y_003585 [Maribacter sp.]|jgi:hypothetical protein